MWRSTLVWMTSLSSINLLIFGAVQRINHLEGQNPSFLSQYATESCNSRNPLILLFKFPTYLG